MVKMVGVLIILSALLLGCEINPSEFGDDEARAFASTITYVKDQRTGLCFGIVASRKTGSMNQSGMGITEVPCSAVESFVQ